MFKKYQNKIISGKEFKKEFPNYDPYKLIENINEKGINYKLGVVTSKIPFNPPIEDETSAYKYINTDGILSFDDKINVDSIISEVSIKNNYLVKMEILDDSQIHIYCSGNRVDPPQCTTDKINVVSIKEISNDIEPWTKCFGQREITLF
jgi:hypothetical protein